MAGVGVNSYQNFMFAVSLILLATMIVGTARVPRAIGYLMGLAAVPMLVQSWVVGTEGFAVPLLAGSLSTVGLPLMLAWSIWLLIVAWRMKEPAQAGNRPTRAGRYYYVNSRLLETAANLFP